MITSARDITLAQLLRELPVRELAKTPLHATAKRHAYHPAPALHIEKRNPMASTFEEPPGPKVSNASER